jgi:hypothetical protein
MRLKKHVPKGEIKLNGSDYSCLSIKELARVRLDVCHFSVIEEEYTCLYI